MVPAPNRTPSSSCPPQSKDPGLAGPGPNLSLRRGSWALAQLCVEGRGSPSRSTALSRPCSLKGPVPF